jgi:hypothetical protein
MNTENVTQSKKNKKSFVVREIPAQTFLDSRLRNSALQVLGLLWSKADVRTGELRIGSHWFTQHELVRTAKKLGISESTFRRIIRDQLIPLGFVKELEREYVPYTDASGRNRKVLGPCKYIVFKTSQEPQGERIIPKPKSKKPRGERVSTSGQKLPLEENVPPLDESTSGQNAKVEEKGSTSGQSTSLVERPDNTYSKAPTSSAVGGDGFAVQGFARERNLFVSKQGAHKSTMPESKETAPAVNPEIEIKKQKLISDSKLWLHHDRLEKPDRLRIEEHFDMLRRQANALGMSWEEIQNTWKAILAEVFPSPKPAPKPTSEPVPEIRNGDVGEIWKRSRDFYRYADKFGWMPSDEHIYRGTILRYLRDAFGVRTPDKLSPKQFRAAWQQIEQGPPKPN